MYIKKHRWLALVTMIFTFKNEESEETYQGEKTINVMGKFKNKDLTLQNINSLQQQAFLNLKASLGESVQDLTLLDSFIGNISYLGYLTDTEFRGNTDDQIIH